MTKAEVVMEKISMIAPSKAIKAIAGRIADDAFTFKHTNSLVGMGKASRTGDQLKNIALLLKNKPRNFQTDALRGAVNEGFALSNELAQGVEHKSFNRLYHLGRIESN